MLLAQRIQNQDRSLWLRILWQYQELSRILYTRFNTSQLADDYRLFDVVAVRLPAKEYALALQRLADMPANHAQYWVSLRYQLGIYRQLANHPDWPSERIVAASCRYIRPINWQHQGIIMPPIASRVALAIASGPWTQAQRLAMATALSMPSVRAFTTKDQ